LSLPDAPLVLYSASMTPELAAQARNFSVAALLEKPVSPGRLVEGKSSRFPTVSAGREASGASVSSSGERWGG
jgi:hypothetical protein